MKNPIVLFTGAALATLAALAGLNMTDWRAGLSDSQKPAEAASQASDLATPPAELNKTDETGGTPEKPADEVGKTSEKPSEMAALPVPEPPKAETVTKPELDTVRVESDGQAIVAGRAEPGAEIALKLGEQVIGKGVTTSDGSWVVVPDQALPKGPHEITIEQKVGDSAPVIAAQSIAVAVPEMPGQQAMVALTEPGTATKVLQTGGNQEQASLAETPPQPEAKQLTVSEAEQPTAPEAEQPTVPEAAEKSAVPVQPKAAETATTPAEPAPETTVAKVEVPDAVSPPVETTPSAGPAPAKAMGNVPLGLDAVDYNDKGDIIFSGRAKPETAVRLYVDNRAVGDAMVDAAGNWTFAGKGIIAPGTHDLRVDQIDKTGKVIARVELPFVRENAEAVAALNEAPAPEKVEAEASVGQPTADSPAPETAELPVQKTAELPAQQPAEPAQKTAELPVENTPEAPAQQAPEQPQATTAMPAETVAEPQTAAEPPKTGEQPQASAPEPAKTAEAESPTTSEVEKTEPAASAPASDQPAADSKKQEVTTTAEAVAATKTVNAERPRTGKVIIQPGNNLWKLSRVIYGRGKNFTVIYQANKEQIRNPRRIYPGQIFAIPGALPPETIDPKRKEPLTSAEGGAPLQ
jgi:nucleoid-associated protein YgaU